MLIRTVHLFRLLLDPFDREIQRGLPPFRHLSLHTSSQQSPGSTASQGVSCIPTSQKRQEPPLHQQARGRMSAEEISRRQDETLPATAWYCLKVFRIMRQWQIWVLPIGYFLVQASYPVYQPIFALWLRSTPHTIYQINVWPTGEYAVGVITRILAGIISNSSLLQGKRWQALIALQTPTIFGCIALAVSNVPLGLKYAAYSLTFTCAGVSEIYYVWFSDLIPPDHEMRGFIIVWSNMFSYIQSIWWTLTVWWTGLGPRFHAALIGCSCLGVGLCLLAVVLRLLEDHDRRIRNKLEESAKREKPSEWESVQAEPNMVA